MASAKVKYQSVDLPANYQKAFKDADIRGLYPSEISPELAYRVAAVFVNEFGYKELLVGRDMRVSSPALHEALVAGARVAGALVYDLGLIDTPALYFASGTRKLPGVMITASHSPAEYNGLKLVFPEAVPLTNKTGLSLIKKTIPLGIVEHAEHGGYKKLNITKEYIKATKEATPLPKFGRPIRLVADIGNGMGAHVISALKDKGIELTLLNENLDGLFPSRGSNPTLAKNQKPIKEALKSGNFDLGIAFDGDADRVAFFDEKATAINSADIGALLAVAYAQNTDEKLKMLYTVLTNRNYLDTLKSLKIKPVRARVGHAFIKEVMRKQDVTFGCEHSAHFYFKDNFYADSGILAVRKLLQVIGNEIIANKPLSKIVGEYQHYAQSEDAMIAVVDKKAALAKATEKIAKKYNAEVASFDGSTISFEDVRIVIKPSVTEDMLNYMVEAKSKKRVKEVLSEVVTLLKSEV